MTHSKQLGSKLISLLLALAMILALMPAISLTAGAVPANELDKGKPQYGDGWTWDGDTLHLFGSNTYSCSNTSLCYFYINMANNEPAVIDISGSLSVNLSPYDSFIASDRPLEIKGAGKITASDNNDGILFRTSSRPITYAGGAICTDGIGDIFQCSSFTMTKGHIEAPNAFIKADSCEISDSYVSLGAFHTNSDIAETNITISKSFVDTKSLLSDKESALNFKLTNSVLRSAAADTEFTNDYAPVFESVENSVFYLSNVDALTWTPTDALANPELINQQADGGGYVFCKQVFTDADLDNNALDGDKLSDSKLSGAFYKSSTDKLKKIYNLELTGGIFIITASKSIYTDTQNDNVSANDAAIILVSNGESSNFGIRQDSGSQYNNSTFVVMNEYDGTSNNDRLVAQFDDVVNCNIYSPTSDSIYASHNAEAGSMTAPDAASHFYVPNGKIQITAFDIYVGYINVTAKTLENSWVNKASLVYHGNFCAESFETDKNVAFDGSDKYSVSFKGVTSSGKILLNDTDATDGTVDFVCEKPDGNSWRYLIMPTGGYTGSASTQLYIGKPVFNTLAEPHKEYEEITLYSYAPAVIDVKLNLPYDQWIFSSKFELADSSGNTINPADVGISYDISGEGNTMKITLSAADDVTEGSYRLYYTMNGQWIGGKTNSSYVDVTVKKYADYTMKFDPDLSVSWPYINEDGEWTKFTADDYTKIVRAKTWTWYGEAAEENGINYHKRTLLLKDGFTFSTTNSNGIAFYGRDDSYIIFNGKCSINADRNSIYALSLLEIKGDSDSTLTINRGMKSDSMLPYSELRIVGGNIRTSNVSTNSANADEPLLNAPTIYLNNCTVFDDASVWGGGKQSVSGNEFKIARNVTLDLAFSTVSVNNGIYVGDLAIVENISNLTIENSPYNGDIKEFSNMAADRMKLVTKPFKLTGDPNIVVADDTVPSSGNCLWGDQKYRIDVTDKFSVTSGLTVSSSYNDYKYSIEHDGDKTYLVIETPNANTKSELKTTIWLADRANYDFCEYSDQSIGFTATLGKVIKASKLGILHKGNYGGLEPEECYTISAKCSDGTEVTAENDGECDYYIFPSNDTLKLSIIPIANRMIKGISFKKWGADDNSRLYIELEPTGDYYFRGNNGAIQLCLEIDETTEPQYNVVSISDDLRRSLENDEIEAITLTYSDYRETVKTFDKKLNEFPTYVLNNEEVTVSITSSVKSVLSINGTMTKYDSKTGAYSATLDISKDTEITAELENLSDLCSFEVWAYNLPNTENKITVTPAPINSLGQYRVGTECEIFANVTDDKFIGVADFNDVEIEPYKQTSEGCYYKVTTAAGKNAFSIRYADLSTLTIAKTANGSVEFSGRLDCGRSSKTLAYGSQVYSIGTGDTVTLTITPDKGYRLKSAKLDGDKAPEVTVENGACTFMMDQMVDWTFTAEFEEIPADNVTVTVKCGENGTVTPSTSDYPVGTKVTLTVTPDTGYEVKSATLDGKTVSLTDGKYTFTLTADCVFSVEFQKKSTGGNTGGSPGGSSGGRYTDTGNNGIDPALNGKSGRWSEIASDISKMDENGKADIAMNGSTTIPSDVLKKIKDKKISAIFKFDAYKSWTIDGSKITSDIVSADLSLIPVTSSAKGVRGSVGYSFMTGGNNVGAELNIQFKNEHAGKFANLYFIKDGKAEYISTGKIAEDGSVTLPGASAKGEYVAMLCDYSDLLGDVNNDGVVNALDSSAMLKAIVGIAKCANAQVGDYNSDGTMNALDASAILVKMVF